MAEQVPDQIAGAELVANLDDQVSFGLRNIHGALGCSNYWLYLARVHGQPPARAQEILLKVDQEERLMAHRHLTCGWYSRQDRTYRTYAARGVCRPTE